MAKRTKAQAEPQAPAIDLDDTELSERVHGDDAPPLAAQPARQGDDGRPYCGKHNCLMRATGSKETHTHYGCPVAGCGETAKRARPQIKIPAEPMKCPDVRCRGRASYLEVDAKRSSVAQLHMQCGHCGFNLKVPRPQFAPQLRRERERAAAADDFAAR